MILLVAAVRQIVAEIKALPVLSEFCIDCHEIAWKYEDYYANFSSAILKEKQSVKEK